MKTLTITRHGGPDVLALREVPDPVCKDGEVCIRVARAGLNFSDVSARMGLYPDAPKPPTTVGYEVSGTVQSVGPGVKLAVGTRVLALTRFSGQATQVVVPEAFAQAIPDAMSFDEAAALPVVYVTAFHMLFNVHHLRPGNHLLVHMAAGGVGLAVVELAKTVKDVTVYGTSSASKHDFLRQAGVRHPIDYRTQDYAEEVRAIAAREYGGRGLDLVLDPLGGPDWKKGYSLLRPTGHLIAYGWSNMNGSGDSRSLLRLGSQFLQMPRFAPLELMDQNRTVSGVNVGHLWDASDVLSEVMTSLLALYRDGKVKPRVDTVFPLSEGPAAHRHLQARKNIGKVLFDCS